MGAIPWTFFFSRHMCVSWLLNPYTGLGQYHKICSQSQEHNNIEQIQIKLILDSKLLCQIFICICSMTFLASRVCLFIIIIIY